MRKSSVVCDACGSTGEDEPIMGEPAGWMTLNLRRHPPKRQGPTEGPRFRLVPDADKPGELIASVEKPRADARRRPVGRHRAASLDLCTACAESLEIKIGGRLLELDEAEVVAAMYAEGWG